MKTGEQLTPESIYELVAHVGFKKYFHLGGMEATEKLIELCHIDKDKYILDVGCASGKTACFVARKYGSRVVGIDLSGAMVARAKERAHKEGVTALVDFQTADAQDLPFDDNFFDVVVGEFITGLLSDKRRAVDGYIRVTKPGGYIGLNEATWIKSPPPKQITEYLAGTFGVKGEILNADGWRELLVSAGLMELSVSEHKVDRVGNKWGDLKDFLGVWHRAVYIYIRSSTFRKFVNEALTVPKNLVEYFGYGIYVGRTSKRD
jgi:ubiquinone/menaquinone biosynthesis C-methylase UbiE